MAFTVIGAAVVWGGVAAIYATVMGMLMLVAAYPTTDAPPSGAFAAAVAGAAMLAAIVGATWAMGDGPFRCACDDAPAAVVAVDDPAALGSCAEPEP